MTALTLVLCFASCEKDNAANEKSKLVKILDEEGDAVYSAKYDNDGNIIEISDYWDVWVRKTNTEYYCSESESTALLNNNGLLDKLISDNLTYTFEYESNGRIISMVVKNDRGNSLIYSFIWENDNIVRIISVEDDGYTDTAQISYGDMKNTKKLWTLGFAECCNIDDEYLPFLMSGLMGECSASLPSSVFYSCPDYRENYTISYTQIRSKAIETETIGGDDNEIYNYVYNN